MLVLITYFLGSVSLNESLTDGKTLAFLYFNEHYRKISEYFARKLLYYFDTELLKPASFAFKYSY